ncbi:MAG: ADP-ribosylglycohydrolase family protein [Bacteroidota bacterium]
MKTKERLKGCIIGGAIGDAMGGFFENSDAIDWSLLEDRWQLSDDTQMTLATLESIIAQGGVGAQSIADHFVAWYNKGMITGIGGSTLKALQELQIGAHWALAGRSGEYAAGNGAAMRIAPLAFYLDDEFDRLKVSEVARITHKNDEAYVGALAIFLAVKAVSSGEENVLQGLISQLINDLPDTRVRDRLIEIDSAGSGNSIGWVAKQFGTSGYVVESVPLSIYAAQHVQHVGFEQVMMELIEAGGDTDSNCAMAGQMMGAYLGYENLPKHLITKVKMVKEYPILTHLINQFGLN